MSRNTCFALFYIFLRSCLSAPNQKSVTSSAAGERQCVCTGSCPGLSGEYEQVGVSLHLSLSRGNPTPTVFSSSPIDWLETMALCSFLHLRRPLSTRCSCRPWRGMCLACVGFSRDTRVNTNVFESWRGARKTPFTASRIFRILIGKSLAVRLVAKADYERA